MNDGKPGSKPYRLFDLRNDPSETTDLASSMPQHVTCLEEQLQRIIDSASD